MAAKGNICNPVTVVAKKVRIAANQRVGGRGKDKGEGNKNIPLRVASIRGKKNFGKRLNAERIVGESD